MREIFHLLFLENLLRISDPRLYVLKGGVNLRFFFNSPRYSEDMDIDVLGGSVSTLKKNGYKILESSSFKRILSGHRIINIKINDPSKAKQTDVTQRFRVRLVTETDEELPTKIEFSRRSDKREVDTQAIEEEIPPAITSLYKRLSFRCRHYSGQAATVQKINALLNRPATQARDVFDLYILFLGNYFDKSLWTFNSQALKKARESILSISSEQYRDQVEEYLNIEGKKLYGGKTMWKQIQTTLLNELIL